MIVTLIPFFLAVLLPINDIRYGPEYVFTVRTNMTGTPQCPHQDATCGDPTGHDFVYRLHCISRKNDTLTCRLKYIDGFAYGVFNEQAEWPRTTDVRKNMTNVPMELLFNEDGIRSIIANRHTHTYDLNILKTIVEQLHPGVRFDDIGNGTFEDATTSTIGRCTVTFNVHPDSVNKETRTRFLDNFRLKLLPSKLQMRNTLVIDKTTNLNDCSYYADRYFGRYGDKIMHEEVEAALASMVSRMEISETSFSSSTTRKGMAVFKNKIYNIVDVTEIILKDIEPAMSDLPIIINPGKTKIIANYGMRSILN